MNPLGRLGCVSFLITLSTLAAPVFAEPDPLHLLDDRGEIISAPLEICWYSGLDSRCEEITDGQVTSVPSDFDSLHIEGPRHGPLSLSRRHFPKPEDGTRSLRIARKARLVVSELHEETRLSLYPADSPSFRQPLLRQTLTPGDQTETWIAARPSVLSLAARGRAPDLHLVDPEPGGTVTIEHRPRPGWSLLTRVRERSTGEPVADAALTLSGLAGYPMSDAQERSLQTNGEGLAVVSGLTTPMIDASVEAPGLVGERVVGWTAGPGSFAFEEVSLGRGGTVEVLVTLDGEPLAGAACSLRHPFKPTHADEVETRPAVDLGRTDALGRCSREGLTPGPYDLLVSPDSDLGGSHVEQITVIDDETASSRLDLRPLVIEGLVLRGDRPEPGYRVEARTFIHRSSRIHREGDRDETDSEGRYSLVVWQEGPYELFLFDRPGTLTDLARIDVTGDELEHDFLLGEHEIAGVVTDEEGEPIPEASVVLRWPLEQSVTYRGARTDEAGRFRYTLDDRSGPAEVSAHLNGYENDQTELEVVRGEALPPIHLRLKRRPGLRGRVVDATGQPLPDIEIHAVRGIPREPSRVLAKDRSGSDGSFFLGAAVDGSTHLFASGPGCPLTVHEPRPEPDATHVLTCPALPSHIRLHLRDDEGLPIFGVSVFLKRGSTVVPRSVLTGHLRSFGLAGASDGSGRLPLIALAPGDYDLYKADETNEGAILSGYPGGFLASMRVGPLETREVEVTLRD